MRARPARRSVAALAFISIYLVIQSRRRRTLPICSRSKAAVALKGGDARSAEEAADVRGSAAAATPELAQHDQRDQQS